MLHHCGAHMYMLSAWSLWPLEVRISKSHSDQERTGATRTLKLRRAGGACPCPRHPWDGLWYVKGMRNLFHGQLPPPPSRAELGWRSFNAIIKSVVVEFPSLVLSCNSFWSLPACNGVPRPCVAGGRHGSCARRGIHGWRGPSDGLWERSMRQHQCIPSDYYGTIDFSPCAKIWVDQKQYKYAQGCLVERHLLASFFDFENLVCGVMTNIAHSGAPRGEEGLGWGDGGVWEKGLVKDNSHWNFNIWEMKFIFVMFDSDQATSPNKRHESKQTAKWIQRLE